MASYDARETPLVTSHRDTDANDGEPAGGGFSRKAGANRLDEALLVRCGAGARVQPHGPLHAFSNASELGASLRAFAILDMPPHHRNGELRTLLHQLFQAAVFGNPCSDILHEV